MKIQDNNRQYRVLKAKRGDNNLFWNKHKQCFVCTTIEAPGRINNHIGLNDALNIMKEYKDANSMKITIDYL